jgi:hypothetical protein
MVEAGAPAGEGDVTVVATVLIWLLGIIGGLLLLVFLMPIGLRARGMFAPWRATGRVDLNWAWGLLGVRLSREKGTQLRLLGFYLPGFRVSEEKKAERKEKKAKKRAEKKEEKKAAGKKRKRGARWAWRNRRLFIRCARALHLRGMLRGTIGVGDPADTAELRLLLDPALERLPGFDARLAWDYLDEVLDLEGALRARIWPVELACILLLTLTRGESRRALLATS